MVVIKVMPKIPLGTSIIASHNHQRSQVKHLLVKDRFFEVKQLFRNDDSQNPSIIPYTPERKEKIPAEFPIHALLVVLIDFVYYLCSSRFYERT